MNNFESLSILDLKLIFLLSKTGNLTRTAGELFISQPAASQRLQQIRDKLTFEIFKRKGKQWFITEEGQLLAKLYEEVAGRMLDTSTAIAELSANPVGTLSVGTSDTLAIHVMPDLVTEFSRLYPGIKIQLTSKPSRMISAEVRSGNLDLGMALENAVHDLFHIVRLFERKDCLIISPQHPLVLQNRLTVKDLNDLPLILLDRLSQSRFIIEEWYADSGIKLNMLMEMGSIEMIKTYVVKDFGAAIVPELSVQAELKRGELIVLQLPKSFPKPKIVLFSNPRKYEKKISRLFIDFVQKYFNI